jgi:phage-related protein
MEDKFNIQKWAGKELKKIKKGNHLHFGQIMDAMDIVEKTGIQKAKKSGEIERIKGNKVKMFEFKISTSKPNVEYRLMGTIKVKTFIIVHCNQKKDQKIRDKDIKVTKERLKDLNLI